MKVHAETQKETLGALIRVAGRFAWVPAKMKNLTLGDLSLPRFGF